MEEFSERELTQRFFSFDPFLLGLLWKLVVFTVVGDTSYFVDLWPQLRHSNLHLTRPIVTTAATTAKQSFHDCYFSCTVYLISLFYLSRYLSYTLFLSFSPFLFSFPRLLCCSVWHWYVHVVNIHILETFPSSEPVRYIELCKSCISSGRLCLSSSSFLPLNIRMMVLLLLLVMFTIDAFRFIFLKEKIVPVSKIDIWNSHVLDIDFSIIWDLELRKWWLCSWCLLLSSWWFTMRRWWLLFLWWWHVSCFWPRPAPYWRFAPPAALWWLEGPFWWIN